MLLRGSGRFARVLGMRRRSKAAVWLGVAVLALALRPPAVADGPRDRFDVVVIDAGHGGQDDGATAASGLAEKDLVLDVARRLARKLEADGLEVVLTRDADTFIPLESRTSVANDARADLFISIHANASRSRTPSGIETYFVSLDSSDAEASAVAERENRALGAHTGVSLEGDPLMALLGDMIATEHVIESSDFAKLVQAELAELAGTQSRGVKQAPFVVLMGVQMPASLIEIGFLSNPSDEKALGREAHRRALVEAIGRAVVAFGKRYDAKRGVARLDAPPQEHTGSASP